jgi:predicted methyltransferase
MRCFWQTLAERPRRSAGGIGLMAAVASVALLMACARPAPVEPEPTPAAQAAVSAPDEAPAVGSIDWALEGPWRLEPERDVWRHPKETLAFWGLAPGMTVLEVLPGRGWYTAILAPYLAETGGRLIAASFDPDTPNPAQRQVLAQYIARFADADTFGAITMTAMTVNTRDLAPPGTVDLAIVARNVHTFMIDGYAEKAFADLFRALKPGGTLGVEQHRASPAGLQDPTASDGYVQEAFVKMLAEEAGFQFVGSTDVNANGRDTKDHPFGVWTLPPILRTAPLGQPPDPSFDTRPFEQIGESDRMTLRFKKPDRPGPAEVRK